MLFGLTRGLVHCVMLFVRVCGWSELCAWGMEFSHYVSKAFICFSFVSFPCINSIVLFQYGIAMICRNRKLDLYMFSSPFLMNWMFLLVHLKIFIFYIEMLTPLWRWSLGRKRKRIKLKVWNFVADQKIVRNSVYRIYHSVIKRNVLNYIELHSGHCCSFHMRRFQNICFC
jgi:hypothetical protein